MKYRSLATILAQSTDDIRMDFCGASLCIPVGKYIYSQFLNKYVDFAVNAGTNYMKKMYLCINDDIDYYLKAITDNFIKCSESMLNEISKDAMSVDINYIDSNSIINYCEERGYFNELYSYREAIYNKVVELAGVVATDAAQRELQTQARPRMQQMTIGGTFKDFAKNQFKTDLANAGVGLLRGIIDSSVNKKRQEDAKQEIKKYIFDLIPSLTDAATSAYSSMAHVIIEFLADGLNMTGISISTSEADRAAATFNNLKKLNPPLEKQYLLAQEIVNLNPCVREYYEYFFRSFPKYRREIYFFADKFSIDLSELVVSETHSYITRCLSSDYDSIKQCKTYLNSVISDLNIHSSDEYEKMQFNTNGRTTALKKNVLFQIIALQLMINKKELELTVSNLNKYLSNNLEDTIDSVLMCEDYVNSIINAGVVSSEIYKIRNVLYDKKTELLISEAKAVFNDDFRKANEAIAFIKNKAIEYGDGADIEIANHEIYDLAGSVFVDNNIGSTVESAKKCYESFVEFADSVSMCAENREKYLKQIQLKTILLEHPQINQNDYQFKDSFEIRDTIDLVTELINPIDKEYGKELCDTLKKKYDAAVNSELDKYISTSPSFTTHAEYEDCILKIQSYPQIDKAKDAAYLYELKLQAFEKDCEEARAHIKNLNKKFNIGEFIGNFIASAIVTFIGLLILSVFINGITENPIVKILKVVADVLIAKKLMKETESERNSSWNKVTKNGKLNFLEVSKIKYPDRVKCKMPRFENGDTSFTLIGKIIKIKNGEALYLYDKISGNSDRKKVAEIPPNAYVGIIETCGNEYYVKYYSSNGFYYGYVPTRHIKALKISKE